MPTGTLLISKLTANPETYRAVLVPADGTPPRSIRMSSIYALRSFLASADLLESIREAAVEQARWRGLAVLKSVEVAVEALKPHAA